MESILSQTMAQVNHTPQNGVAGVAPGEYHIYLHGQHVDTAYGDEWAAWDTYREWAEAGAEVEQYADVAIDDIPDSYWKNGHIELLRLEPDPQALFEARCPADDYGLPERTIVWRVAGQVRELEV